MTVTVSVEAPPPITSEVVDATTSIVEPLIRIGICVDLPLAVAVIVAVRLAGFVVPEENVTVALPDASLTADPSERKPVSAENAIVTPETAAFAASTTVAVMVVEVLLSDATLVSDALKLMAAAAGGGVMTGGGVVVVVPEPPPPHAERSATNAIPKRYEMARAETIFNLYSLLPNGKTRRSIIDRRISEPSRE